MKKSVIHTPHDKLFRSSLQFPKVAREFLELYLPAHIKQKLDFTTITYCQTSFINEELKLSQTDVLFKVNLDKEPAYVYILAEHESGVDHLIAFWLIKYMVSIWDYHIKEHQNNKALPLPLIIPLIFYTGGADYTAERQFSKLFGNQSELMNDMLNHPFHLINVNELPEKAMTAHIYAGTMAFIMRKRFQNHLNQEIHKIIANLNQLESCDHRRFLLELIKYMFNIDNEHTNVNELIGILKHEMSPDVENEIMSLAEKLIEQGIEQGIEKGRLEEKVKTAKNMLAESCDPVFVVKVTGLSIERVKTIQKDLKK